ncbi:phosphoribosyltransferase family protein [Vibrio mytili]|uniref:ComF family protein n=1 Tax=Vibrio mytili TaxID=50718 RepID=UPI002F3F56E0
MISHQWQNIMHRVMGSQCGLCRLPLTHESTSNPLRWCPSCLAHLAPEHRCIQCGLALPDDEQTSPNPTICGDCLSDPPPWQYLFTLGNYGYPLSQEVQRFKDHGESWHVSAMTQLLAARIPGPTPLITSVPLHWRRYLQRGFNQSDVLARHLAKHLNGEFDSSIFRRVKHSASQRGRKKSSREQSLKGVFVLNKKPTSSHVAIVDDVVTTGSTIRQLCYLLLEVGVERIDIYCICRTAAPDSL